MRHCFLRADELSFLFAEPRNDSKPARSLMFRILSTRFLSRLRGWNYLDCFGFDAEKLGTEARTSRHLRPLLLRAKKPEELAASIHQAKSQCRYTVGGIRVN